MKNTKFQESGRTFFDIARTLGLLALTVVVFFVMFNFFMRVVFEDSATEDTIKELSSRAVVASSRRMA